MDLLCIVDITASDLGTNSDILPEQLHSGSNKISEEKASV